MAGFLNKIKSGSASTTPAAKDPAAKKNLKEEPAPELTPLEKMLQHGGPLREDGSDRFYGFENFGNTCYCNSIVQALFYSDLFRDNVINCPSLSNSDTPNGDKPKVNVTIRPPMAPSSPTQPPNEKQKPLTTSQLMKQRQAINTGQPVPGQVGVRPEDKPDTPEYKKKQAMLKGPVLELARENAAAYGMDECTFTGLKDIFLALLESSSRTGVLSPQRFLEIFKRDNEMFRNSMHQDAHEFYGLVLNDVITNVETNARRMQEQQDAQQPNGLVQSVQNALGSAFKNHATGYQSPGTGWVHDIFEGVLTSETKCLTCETTSQRDETFLDLSIDLEQHSSVTSCLRKFSAEEMLCERNKFHCDHCGGLQEAEKRMKVKRLPKVLTLHLKRFKYTEDYSRLQKLFHRVVYPYHLRMFNTTEDADDPDRLYELYAVVVHIGGNAYHGHYVSIIKTKDRGWVLFDDEMVEPVDNHYVRNFFGDKPGMATAYVLFYQETTFEKVRQEQERDGMEEVFLASQAANLASEEGMKHEPTTPLKRQTTQPIGTIPEHDTLEGLVHASTAPGAAPTSPVVAEPVPITPSRLVAEPASMTSSTMPSTTPSTIPSASQSLPASHTTPSRLGSKEDKKREKKEREAAEKAEKAASKDREKSAKLDDKKRREDQLRAIQSRRNEQDELSKVLAASKKTAAQETSARKKENGGSKRSFSLFGKDKDAVPPSPQAQSAEGAGKPEKTKGRMSMSLGRKKSTSLLP